MIYGYPKWTALFLVPIARRMLVSHSEPCAESEDGVWEKGQGTFCVNRFHPLELGKRRHLQLKEIRKPREEPKFILGTLQWRVTTA